MLISDIYPSMMTLASRGSRRLQIGPSKSHEDCFYWRMTQDGETVCDGEGDQTWEQAEEQARAAWSEFSANPNMV